MLLALAVSAALAAAPIYVRLPPPPMPAGCVSV
jgi:hypothetical protein